MIRAYTVRAFVPAELVVPAARWEDAAGVFEARFGTPPQAIVADGLRTVAVLSRCAGCRGWLVRGGSSYTVAPDRHFCEACWQHGVPARPAAAARPAVAVLPVAPADARALVEEAAQLCGLLAAGGCGPLATAAAGPLAARLAARLDPLRRAFRAAADAGGRE